MLITKKTSCGEFGLYLQEVLLVLFYQSSLFLFNLSKELIDCLCIKFEAFKTLPGFAVRNTIFMSKADYIQSILFLSFSPNRYFPVPLFYKSLGNLLPLFDFGNYLVNIFDITIGVWNFSLDYFKTCKRLRGIELSAVLIQLVLVDKNGFTGII